MLTLHSLLCQPDQSFSEKTGKYLAVCLLVVSLLAIRADVYFVSAADSEAVPVSVTADETADEEESGTKAKVQTGFEDIAVSVDALSQSMVSENLSVNSDSEDLEETKEVISALVKEKAAQTVEAANLLSQDDYNVLLRIVEAEAGGEDIKGKILVANVIMNRVNSKTFPNTVRSVVYQRIQFSPVGDGRINKVKVSSDTKKAVQKALEGEDYSRGAYYFSARDQADASSMAWFDSDLKWLFKHGAHEFYTFRK